MFQIILFTTKGRDKFAEDIKLIIRVGTFDEGLKLRNRSQIDLVHSTAGITYPIFYCIFSVS